jgi:hypothetical protein
VRNQGIGLTMVQRLTELHGGGVEVESAGPGQGSTFILRLPLPLSESPAASPGGISRPAVRAVRVLVVDDDPAILDSTALLLEINGHLVKPVEPGKLSALLDDAAGK